MTYAQLAQMQASQYEHDIILARDGSRLIELGQECPDETEVTFLTTASVSGHLTYVRGVKLLMLSAIDKVCGGDTPVKVTIRHKLGDSYYCLPEGTPVDDTFLSRVEKTMRELVSSDRPILKKTIHTRDAVKLFAERGMDDKSRLFTYRRCSNVNVYELEGYCDYFYGYMPVSTGILKYFHLQAYQDGFLLVLPGAKTPEKVGQFVDSPKLFATLQESARWGEMMQVDSVGALNRVITEGGITDLILVQEALQEKKIGAIAEQIARAGNKKFVMIAGPSSSGKTSFSHRLSIQLRTLGLKPHPIALDNYFKDRKDTPKDENGKYDFECLEAIDVEKFNQDMVDLLEGKRVELPYFNFLVGQREYQGDFLQLGEDDILVIEGIHGLNEKMSYALPKENKFKIYISALTQLNIDEHNRIPTTDGRLLRRMVRDARTRGSSAAVTIGMWPSVRRGEDKYIFPFQEEADVMFNSGLIYELAVIKPFAESILFGIPKEMPEYEEAKRLLKFLDYFIGVSTDVIPKNSLMREFVGGSIFKV